eukprot:7384254-Prymnesium_polylepis.1
MTREKNATLGPCCDSRRPRPPGTPLARGRAQTASAVPDPRTPVATPEGRVQRGQRHSTNHTAPSSSTLQSVNLLTLPFVTGPDTQETASAQERVRVVRAARHKVRHCLQVVGERDGAHGRIGREPEECIRDARHAPGHSLVETRPLDAPRGPSATAGVWE